MKILILNGSPHPDGNTSAMVHAYAEGAAEAGHSIHIVDVCKKGSEAVLPVNTAIRKEMAGAFSRTICRRYIRCWKRQR